MLLIMSGSFKSNLAGSSSLRICLKDEIDNCREEVVVTLEDQLLERRTATVFRFWCILDWSCDGLLQT